MTRERDAQWEGSCRPDEARSRAALSLALDVRSGEILDRLGSRGVRSLLLKGPAFARWLYDNPADRLFGDLDLLIAPDDFAVARLCVAELGFEAWQAGLRPNERPGHHEVWHRPDSVLTTVELHRTLMLLTAAPALVWRRLSDDARTIEVGGAATDIPGPAASALIVAIHACAHGGSSRQPMNDLVRALERVDEETWRAAAVLADELGGSSAFAAGLGLTPRGLALAHLLGLSPGRASRVARLYAGTAPDTAAGLERLLTTRGLGARLTLIGQELAPSRSFMRLRYPLARRGRLGLAASYLLRPVRLAVKLPRAARALSRKAPILDARSRGKRTRRPA